MDSVFVAPDSISPRSLDIAALGETRVGIFPGIGIIVAKGVKAGVAPGVKYGTRPAVDTSHGVAVTISIIMA